MFATDRNDFRPMLCHTLDVPKFLKKNRGRETWFVQPKLNGIRCIWIYKDENSFGLFTRKGKPILAVDYIVDELLKVTRYFGSQCVLDGELFTKSTSDKKISLQKIVSSVRRTENIEEPNYDIGFQIFDGMFPEMGSNYMIESFTQRYGYLISRFLQAKQNVKIEHLEICETRRVDFGNAKSEEDFDVYRNLHEGTIMRAGNGIYEPNKRSHNVLKVKKFQDAEFKVVGVTPATTYTKQVVEKNTPGAKEYRDGTWYKDVDPIELDKLGSLICETADGRTFMVGSGFSDELRDELWQNQPIGQQVTVQFQELSDDGIPLFPVFIAIRDYE